MGCNISSLISFPAFPFIYHFPVSDNGTENSERKVQWADLCTDLTQIPEELLYTSKQIKGSRQNTPPGRAQL